MRTIDWGLVVFIAVVLLNIAGLLLDEILLRCQQPTVTDWVRHGHAWFGWLVILLQLLGAVALAFHFEEA